MKRLWFKTSCRGRQGYGQRLVTLLVFFFFPSLQAQQPDTLKGPDIHIKVHTDRDDQGNIIRYDSAYSYSWSSTGDSIPRIIDSLLQGHDLFPHHFWPFRPGMLMPDSLPGYIISPFDFNSDPFFYGFTDTTFYKSIERFFEEFRKGFYHGHAFPQDSLITPYFRHIPAFPQFPPVPDFPESDKKHRKAIKIDI